MTEGQIDVAAVEAVLADFKDPETGRSILKLEQASDIHLDDGRLSMTLALTTWAAPIWDDIHESLRQKLTAAFPRLRSIAIQHATHPRPPQKLGQIGLTAKSAIAVASGKGGVGKSTIAACLALGLARSGCKVGLMDADVYGPSIPHLLGMTGSPVVENERLIPLKHGEIPVVSMGFMIPDEEAVIWRGPMLHSAVTQLLRDTQWGDLDYLIIDLPPGTGDVALTLSQLLPLTGAVVVCTPQDVALLDAVRAIAMFRKVDIPVLGLVENMSGFVCPGCGQRHEIFGSGGARRRAEQLGVAFLGDVPIHIGIRQGGDAGATATALEEPALATCLQAIARQLVKNLAASAAQSPPQPQLPVLGSH